MNRNQGASWLEWAGSRFRFEGLAGGNAGLVAVV